jgi:hypothetical protein
LKNSAKPFENRPLHCCKNFLLKMILLKIGLIFALFFIVAKSEKEESQALPKLIQLHSRLNWFFDKVSSDPLFRDYLLNPFKNDDDAEMGMSLEFLDRGSAKWIVILDHKDPRPKRLGVMLPGSIFDEENCPTPNQHDQVVRYVGPL